MQIHNSDTISVLVKVSTIVHPKAKKPRIKKDKLGTIHIYVKETPVEGKANKAVIEALAKYFNIKKGGIFLLSGIKSKNKIFEIINN